MDLSGMPIFCFECNLETIYVMTCHDRLSHLCMVLVYPVLTFPSQFFCGFAHFRVYNRLLHCRVFWPMLNSWISLKWSWFISPLWVWPNMSNSDRSRSPASQRSGTTPSRPELPGFPRCVVQWAQLSEPQPQRLALRSSQNGQEHRRDFMGCFNLRWRLIHWFRPVGLMLIRFRHVHHQFLRHTAFHLH